MIEAGEYMHSTTRTNIGRWRVCDIQVQANTTQLAVVQFHLLSSGLSPSALESHQNPPHGFNAIKRLIGMTDQRNGSRACAYIMSHITAGRELHPAPKVVFLCYPNYIQVDPVNAIDK